MKDEYKKAYQLASELHAGQKRYCGEDYIMHCVRVAENFQGKDYIVSMLHDTIEDSEDKEGVYNKIKEVFGINIAQQVAFLTHDRTETYKQYIYRICNVGLEHIKLADIIDNLTGMPSKKQKEKYRAAAKIIMQEIKFDKSEKD